MALSYGQTCEVSGKKCIFKNVTLTETEVLPENINFNPNIMILIFEGGKLHSVPSEVFTIFQNLRELHIIVDKVDSIKKETFKDARMLEYLKMRGKFQSLETKSFLGAEN